MVDLTANSQTDRPESAAPRRDGVQQLLSLIDDMRARPTRRQGDLALPTVVIGGQTDGVSAAIRARQNPPPCAFVTVNEVKGQLRYRIFADVLRQAAEQLASTAPRGEPRIRFPLLYHVLWLIGLPLPTDQNEIEDYVKREIANRARQRSLTGSQGARSARANIRAYVEGPLTAWFAIASILNVAWFLAWDISLTPVFLSVAISIVGAVGHIWALSRSWAGGMRYRWFSRQPYIWPEQDEPGDRPTDAAFFASRVLHVRGMVEKSGPPYGTTAARHEAPQPDSRSIELLIVNAFLEDLRQAYERSLWKIWRRVTWTRTIYPMLLIDGECGPLAESFEQVRAKTATPDPLLLMAAPAEDGGIAADMTTPSSTSRRPEDLDRTWSAWKAALARDRRIGSRRVLAVDIDDKHARLLQADGSIPRSARRKPFLSQLWVPVALVTTLAVGPAAYVVTVEFDTCQWGIKRVETGECIGVGVDGFSFDQRLKPVTDRIDANNKKVLKSGNPHVTVYHLGGFSVPKDSAAGDGDLLADAHGELMGALLLQERLIDNSADRTIPLLQLLPVNAGSAYRYASDAVDAMLEQLDQHSNVIGVIGANESREPVKQALKKLSSRALPVITTSATYDDLSKVDGNYLPNVFPLAPPNTELAAHTAHWAKVGIPGALNQAKNVVVLMDDTENDLYTSDLGERFRVAFGAGARKATFSGADSIRPNVERICREMTPRPDLIFYAGRSTQFGEFHDAASNACHGITVIAGDAVTQFINDRISQLAEPRVKLFYTPLASEHSWSKVPQINQTDFYQSAF